MGTVSDGAAYDRPCYVRSSYNNSVEVSGLTPFAGATKWSVSALELKQDPD
jgi:hypothetical protein